MKVIRSLDHKLRLYEPTHSTDNDDDIDDNNDEDRQAGIVAKVGVRSVGNKKRKTIRPPTRNNRSNKKKDMSADKSFDQWRRDQQMTRIAANDVTVTANPTEADSDIAPQTSSSRARTPNATVTANPLEADSGIDVTVTANPLEADSGIEGAAPCASPGLDIAGPRVSDNEEKVAQGDNDNNNKDAIKDDTNDKTKQPEPYRSPYELLPGDECSNQLNIVDVYAIPA